MPVFLTRKQNNIINRAKRKSFVAQLIIVFLGVELLFLSGFTGLTLPTATPRNLKLFVQEKVIQLYEMLPRKAKRQCEIVIPDIVASLESPLPAIRYSLYVPQAPAAIFLGYAFGWPIAFIAAAIYLIFGFVGPLFNVYVFAAGSGVNYYLQPGFGYLLGLVAAAGIVGWLGRGERKSLNQLLSLLAGIVSIHVIGLTYLLGICLFGAINEATGQQLTWSGWLFEEARNLSWYAVPYDVLFAFLLVGISFPFRWLFNVLTAPDIGLPAELTEEEKLLDFKLADK